MGRTGTNRGLVATGANFVSDESKLTVRVQADAASRYKFFQSWLKAVVLNSTHHWS